MDLWFVLSRKDSSVQEKFGVKRQGGHRKLPIRKNRPESGISTAIGSLWTLKVKHFSLYCTFGLLKSELVGTELLLAFGCCLVSATL